MKYFVKTYGCQMNFADSRRIEELMHQQGYQPAGDYHQADLVIVNTCSVRKHAENRAVGWIKSVSGHCKKVMVIGCLARHKPELLKEAGADIVSYQFKLDEMEIENLDNSGLAELASPVVAEVPIVRGCERFCSYCIVPYLRGPVRSRSPLQVKDDIESLVARGTRLIQLLGQNVLSYNYNHCRLVELIREIEKIEKLYLISFLTSHPADLQPDLIELMASSPKMLKYLHLPFQSGSDRLLKLMNRGYRRRQYLDKIKMIRSIIPDIKLTTDVMVGLPGETNQDYHQTLDLMLEVRFDEAYMFAYSPREGTLDNLQENQLNSVQKQKRLQKLIDIQRKITLNKLDSRVGSEVKLLVVKPAKIKPHWYSLSTDYTPVLINGDFHPGQVVGATVTELRGGSLIGQAV
ncbi:MAG: hypothetical protein APR63_06970 [Desulfuromonas sp. SDB]|nr:MAG: hypothetical protein APR63_06970 [Desulfuromonas sp. SDB]